MEIKETKLKGLLVIQPRVFEDARGYFFESYNEVYFKNAGLNLNFVQDNQKYPHGLGGRELAPEFACGKPEWMRIAEMTNRPLAD